MLKKSGGKILNTASIYGLEHTGDPTGMAYSVAKAGVISLTKNLAKLFSPKILVNAVAPGWIASSGMDHYPEAMAEHIRALPKKVPAGRLGTESEVSAAVVFLLSPAAAFISGSCLRVDGAVPNAKRVWDHPIARGKTQAFDGFHLAQLPKILRD